MAGNETPFTESCLQILLRTFCASVVSVESLDTMEFVITRTTVHETVSIVFSNGDMS